MGDGRKSLQGESVRVLEDPGFQGILGFRGSWVLWDPCQRATAPRLI